MHKSQKDLKEELEHAGEQVLVDRIYVHFKSPDMRYKVIGFAVDAGNSEVVVIYKALYDEGVTFVRPLTEWLDEVERDGKKSKRFTLEG